MMNKKYFNFILIAAIVFTISSCTDEDTTLGTDKYTGDWSCKETQGGVSTTFTITISKHGSEDTLDVYNFNNLGSNEKAIFIVNENSVVIPSQDVGGSPSFTVSGFGTYSGGKINLDYKVDNEDYTAVCSN